VQLVREAAQKEQLLKQLENHGQLLQATRNNSRQLEEDFAALGKFWDSEGAVPRIK